MQALTRSRASSKSRPKPKRARLIATGRVYWNSGMFAFGARRVLEELGRYRPDILDAARKAFAGASDDLGFLRLGKEAFLACPAEAIDRAVMERTAHAAVIPAEFEWSDVGSWDALWDLARKGRRRQRRARRRAAAGHAATRWSSATGAWSRRSAWRT